MGKKDALSYAYKLLGCRDYLSCELHDKIEGKFGVDEADKTVTALKDMGYVDDDKVAGNYIRSKLTSGYGPYYVSAKLYSKGYPISCDEIVKVAEKEDIDLEEQVSFLVDRYTREKKNEEDPYRIYVRCMTFLRNRGYPLWICNKIVKKGDFER